MAIQFPSNPNVNQTYTYGSRTWTWTGYGWQATTTTQGPQGIQGVQGVQGAASAIAEVQPLDDLRPQFDGTQTRFLPSYQSSAVSVTNSFRLLVSLNGIVQKVKNSSVVWDNPLLIDSNVVKVDDSGYIQFATPVPAGSTFDGRVMTGPVSTTLTTTYPFNAADLLIGAF
jgi:hypothetical protein